MSQLSAYLNGQKRAFIDSKGRAGGTADQFRGHVRQRYLADKLMFDSMILDALMGNATKTWRQTPRRSGDDLFSIRGYVIPEYLTRLARGCVPDPDAEVEEADEEAADEEHYEKVSQRFATIEDYYADATIKLRKAAQSSSRAEQQMRNADIALRLARGDKTALLKDVADKIEGGSLPEAAD